MAFKEERQNNYAFYSVDILVSSDSECLGRFREHFRPVVHKAASLVGGKRVWDKAKAGWPSTIADADFVAAFAALMARTAEIARELDREFPPGSEVAFAEEASASPSTPSPAPGS